MENYKQKIIQHLGIVAGICNEIELIKTIDGEIDKPKRKVTVGQAVQSIILNALGFSGRAMYLHPEYYRKRPVELLVGEGIEPEDLNDDSLGGALDAKRARQRPDNAAPVARGVQGPECFGGARIQISERPHVLGRESLSEITEAHHGPDHGEDAFSAGLFVGGKKTPESAGRSEPRHRRPETPPHKNTHHSLGIPK